MKEETASPSSYILYMSLGKRASYVSEKVVEGAVIRVTVHCKKNYRSYEGGPGRRREGKRSAMVEENATAFGPDAVG